MLVAFDDFGVSVDHCLDCYIKVLMDAGSTDKFCFLFHGYGGDSCFSFWMLSQFILEFLFIFSLFWVVN